MTRANNMFDRYALPRRSSVQSARRVEAAEAVIHTLARIATMVHVWSSAAAPRVARASDPCVPRPRQRARRASVRARHNVRSRGPFPPSPSV